ncbi:sugar phosphate isomerase/epimerase family protein [Persicitalea sp.]|uniref:sugar phosphate isomerase/epimerase family protein n=1 Tax=Persicitalea sp. TaxID=3100273 RepID=UPI0035938E30
MEFNRRKFLKTVPLGGIALATKSESRTDIQADSGSGYLKLSCNIFSFNDLLRKGEMSLEEVFEFCSDLGFAAVDPTGYYFPNYPEVPSDGYIFKLKKKAFLLGLDISGTGVRTDFSTTDSAQRAADVELVRKWVEVAAKMDAPVLRIFAGKGVPVGQTEKQTMDQAVESIAQCVEFGKKAGVMIVVQNHNELLKTVEQVLYIREQIPSDWLGINLDIGSLRAGDPYEEVAKLAPYAYTWQIKENVYRQGVEEKTDAKKIIDVIKAANYRGYLPLETLKSDPRVQLPLFVSEIRAAL